MKINITTNIPLVSNKMLLNPAKINIALRNAIRKSALLVERYSKMKTPVDTGRLRSSIRSTITELTATVSPTVDYAIFVHDGTRYMRARPFMKWGADDATAEIKTVFDREIKGALR